MGVRASTRFYPYLVSAQSFVGILAKAPLSDSNSGTDSTPASTALPEARLSGNRSSRGFSSHRVPKYFFIFFWLHALNPCVTFTPVVGSKRFAPPQDGWTIEIPRI